MKDYFKASEWYGAVTMQERISTFKESKSVKVRPHLNSKLGKLRMNQWISQSPFSNESYFNRWLELVGITEKEFLFVLSDPKWIVAESNIDSSEWFFDIVQAFTHYSIRMDSPHLLSKGTETQGIDGFLVIIGPLIEQALQRLRDGIREINRTAAFTPFDADSIESILSANLPSRILRILNRTLVLELNIARLRGILNGDTPSERFKAFLQIIRQKDKIISLLKEYPVLARQLTLCLNQWLRFSLEFLRHLCKDYEQLQSTLSPDKSIGILVELQSEAGDKHRDGRSVLILRFSTGYRVVYKPRSMGLDVRFQDLLHWINDRVGKPLFYTMKVLDCGTYGWEQYIRREDCTQEEEVERFYERMGGYLCILYLLRASDFHSENVIACGEHPILIDLETLFQPQLKKGHSKLADENVRRILNFSVLCVGLLPQWQYSDDETRPADFSGIGARKDQIMHFEVPVFEGTNTDEMRIIPKKLQIKKLDSRPILNHIDVDEIQYVNAITDGFTKIYRLIMRCKIDLLAENGFLTQFSRDEIRVVLRATRTYSVLLNGCYHPDVLRDAFDRDLLLNQLWMHLKHFPQLAKIILMELEDLQKGDIPIFTTYPASHDIWSSSRVHTKDFFDVSGMTLVRKLVQDMSENDLQRQLWITRASLATISSKNVPSQLPAPPLGSRRNKIHRKYLLAAAKAVGDRLVELVVRGEKDAGWIGLEFDTSKDQVSLMPLGIDLYDGLPGIVLFLAYLGMVTQDRSYSELARASLVNIRYQIKHKKSFMTGIGAFNGWGGLVYTLTHLGVLWKEPHLINEAERITTIIPDLIKVDKWYDIIFGSAGCIASLLCLDHVAPSDYTINIAIECGNRLVAHATSMESGIGWINPANKERPLIGFSHGTTGILWALLKLANRTDNYHFTTTALSALEYERMLFSVKHENWPDLRKFENREDVSNKNFRYSTSWCHGAPGIGLARLDMVKYLHDPQIASEIEIALRTTLAKGFGYNHSLCHGDLGNLEFLLAGSNYTNTELKVSMDHRLQYIIEAITNYGYRCGNILGAESPGLMTGIAGIGYELLRLAEPTKVPSVLTLSAPRSL
jgi:type 2 lantibiotic biosynthesis protein LanM